MSSDKYKDMIDLPHHVSKKHPQMSMRDRAAQFAPFAALTGLDEEMEETAKNWIQKVNESGDVSGDSLADE